MALSDKYNFEPLNPLQWGRQMPTMPGAMAPDPTWAGGLLGAGYDPDAVNSLLYAAGTRAIPALTGLGVKGAKEIWDSPIGNFLRTRGWDTPSWRDDDEEPFPIGGDPREGEFLGPDTFGQRQDTTPPLFGDDSVGAARIAERRSLDEAGFSSRSIQAARNLEDREYTAQELMKIFYPTSRKGQPKPSPFSAEELKWMGVPDYIKAMENAGQKISYAALNEYMENNRVQLKREVRAETDTERDDARPVEVEWDEGHDFYEHDKPAWSEYLQTMSEDHRDDIATDVASLREHFEGGGQTHDIPRELLSSLGTIFDMEGWDLVEVTHDEWQERNEDSLMDNITTLAENRAAHYYKEGGSQHWVREATVGDLTYRIEGNDDYGWTVYNPEGEAVTENQPGAYGLGGQAGQPRQRTRTFADQEEAENYVELDALESGYLRDEADEEQTTVAGPGSNYEQYNFFGLEGAEPDSYQEVILGYNRWGPTFGGNYPQGGYAGIPDDTTSKTRAIDQGITLYSEPHFGTRNAFLHIRMHDRYLPSDGRGNVAFIPMGKRRDEGGGYSTAKWYEGKIEFPPWQEEGSTDFADILKARLVDAGLDNYITLRAAHRETGWTQDFTMESVDYDAQRRIQNIIESINANQSRGEGGITAEWKPHKANPEMTHGPGWDTGHNVVDILDEDGKYWSKLSDGFEPVKTRILDEMQSTWNTKGREHGFAHPTKYVAFNPISGKDLGWYDTKEEMIEAFPELDVDFPDRLVDYTPPLGATDTTRYAMHPLMEKGETYMAGFKDFLRTAKEDGIEYVFIPGGLDQTDRYSIRKGDERYQKMINFYDEMFPRMINKFLKKVGSEELQQIGVGRGKDLKYGWLLKMTPALEAAIMEGLDLYSKVIKPKAGLLGRREEGLLAYA